jgi:hypothetical protein
MKTRTYGPTTITGGHRVNATVIEVSFTLAAHDASGTVVITTQDDQVVAHLRGLTVAEDLRDDVSDAASVPLAMPRTDGIVHAPLTLPTAGSDGLHPGVATADALKLAAPTHGSWITEAGGTVLDNCDEHTGGLCLVYTGPPAPAIAAVIATRLYPVLIGHRFGDALPWDAPPRRGVRGNTVHGGGGGGGNGATLVSQMELYDKLLDSLDAAVAVVGGRVEYGIVEHHFAELYPDDYRTLHAKMGHISVDHPMKSTLSGYLAQLLGRLSGRDEIEYWPSHGTGYWNYNTTISSWSLPGGASATTTSWAQYCGQLGCSQWAWPAARVLLGADAPEVTGAALTWPDGRPLQSDDIPTNLDDAAAHWLAEAFDATGYLATCDRDELARISENHAAGHGLPKDAGLLRSILRLANDDALRLDVLTRLKGVLR